LTVIYTTLEQGQPKRLRSHVDVPSRRIEFQENPERELFSWRVLILVMALIKVQDAATASSFT
jgi:hypothetical protein